MFSNLARLIILTFFVLSNANHSFLKNTTLSCEPLDGCANDQNIFELWCEISGTFTVDDELSVDEVKIDGDKNGNEDISLEIGSEKMTKTIPRDIGRKVNGKLKSLKITGSPLSFIKRVDFYAMTNLNVLNLASNQLTSVPHDAFYNLTSLETLFLNDNQIGALPVDTLFSLTNLKSFYAEYNKIERLESGFFRNNLEIENIFLQNNDLKYIHEDFLNFSSLFCVDLRDNADYCRECEILSSEKSQNVFDQCENRRENISKTAKNEFEECVKIKAEEMDEKWEKLEVCYVAKSQILEEIEKNFTKCERIHKIEKCILIKKSEEAKVQNTFESCIAHQAFHDDEITELLQTCYGAKKSVADKITEVYNSCMFCHKIASENGRDRCDLRYMRDYGHDVEKFQADVRKFFLRYVKI